MYFFSCYAFKKLKYRVIELKKVYRQDDRDFINLLNDIRTAKVKLEDIKRLDTRYEPNYVPSVKSNVVTLMTHIHKTDDWNEMMFSKVRNKLRTYDAKARDWHGERFPVECSLCDFRFGICKSTSNNTKTNDVRERIFVILRLKRNLILHKYNALWNIRKGIRKLFARVL